MLVELTLICYYTLNSLSLLWLAESFSLRLRLITPTSSLIILDITKTSTNNCLWSYMLWQATMDKIVRPPTWGTTCIFIRPIWTLQSQQHKILVKSVNLIKHLSEREFSKTNKNLVKCTARGLWYFKTYLPLSCL